MKAALIDSYLDFVLYMGVTENYPKWFSKELKKYIYTDEHRYTFYVPSDERRLDYYDKILIEDYSVFLRKEDGSIFVTDYDTFESLYQTFRYDAFSNSGMVAFRDDCIEYVEARGGIVTADYPDWFYEYFTESINMPEFDESILVNTDGDYSVREHSVFLRNRFGEIKAMEYRDFIKYYDPSPEGWFDI